ncbi:MAG: ABC transporter substrate-binding protein [Dysgonamonadaceae bacterium]|jgi:iron complex transport system substrate-binding protein|nr:ABC transporter substrate-binding protein [Dysgonamonadaceae bacterium]
MKSYFCIIFCFVLFSCQNRVAETPNRRDAQSGVSAERPSDSIVYAQGFQIETHPAYILLTVRNPWDIRSVLQRYVLVPKNAALPDSLPEGVLIRTPLERTISSGSVQCGFFAEFDALSTLVGVCEPQYIQISSIQEGIRKGNIADVGRAADPDIEKIMLAGPDAIFIAPIDGVGYGQIDRLNIPLIECVDYMEASPLGRAEWIRFLALFFDKQMQADSLFRETVDRYNNLKARTTNVSDRPSLLAETVYNGVWYLPGGDSYMAHLYHDAGAHYLWEDDNHTGSLSLSFESVLLKAEKARIWLLKYNSPHRMTYDELEQEYRNYNCFEAFKNRNIFSCNTGKVTYYEELPIHPDYVLKDLVWIFHPELLPDYQPKYFERMQDTDF